MTDAQILLRDIAGDAATKTASRVNPSEDALSQIDRPAEDNTWHDVPDLSRDNLRSQARSTFDKNKPFNREQAKDIGANAADHANAQANAQNGVVDQNGNIDHGAAQQTGRTGYESALGQAKDHYDQNVPQETKDSVNHRTEKTKNYLQGKLPQERREQTIWRLKKMVTEIQGHSDCKLSRLSAF